MHVQYGRYSSFGRVHLMDSGVWAMAVAEHRDQELIHLVRLGWYLRCLGVASSLIGPVSGEPLLEVVSAGRSRLRVRVVCRAWGRIFTWRPWWSRIWRRDEWVWALDDDAAELITAVSV